MSTASDDSVPDSTTPDTGATRVRRQRTTVSGLTMTSTSAQRHHRRNRTSQKARSAMRMRGQPDVWRRLASCWRRARFSSANSARMRKVDLHAQPADDVTDFV